MPVLAASGLDVIPSPWRAISLIAFAFLLAWLVSHWAGRLAALVVGHYEKRTEESEEDDTGVFTSLKRRETMISVVRTSVRYAAFVIALVFSLAQLAGAGRGTAVAGASLVVLLIGFACQRFLIDILTGMFMLFEGWFSVGDTIIVEPSDLEGVVEEVSLRSTKLRAVNGETLRVHNSTIQAVRVLPRGVRDITIELFVRDEEAARTLVEEVARLVPVGPTYFVDPPWVEEAVRLDEELVHVKARATVVPGREWLAHELLPSVLRERAPEGLIVHGPVVMDVDDASTHRYARSALISRRRRSRAE